MSSEILPVILGLYPAFNTGIDPLYAGFVPVKSMFKTTL